MSYELILENYQGPIAKLLELIEEKKLAITLVNLAEVTGSFFEYIKELENSLARQDSSLQVLGGQVADFLVIASKLLLIKSKVLLPTLPLTDEEETDIKNLELRLKLYQELKQTQVYIKTGWHAVPVSLSREFLMARTPSFYPPAAIGPAELKSGLQNLLGEIEKFLKPVVRIKKEMVDLKTKIEEIFSRLTEKPVGFGQFKNGKSKSEIVTLFLAILHLIREQLISADQPGKFEEIIIARNGGAA